LDVFQINNFSALLWGASFPILMMTLIYHAGWCIGNALSFYSEVLGSNSVSGYL
jgi:hypothetical protein